MSIDFNNKEEKSDCFLASGDHFIYVKLSTSAEPQRIGAGVERGWEERKEEKRKKKIFKKIEYIIESQLEWK